MKWIICSNLNNPYEKDKMYKLKGEGSQVGITFKITKIYPYTTNEKVEANGDEENGLVG